MSDTEYRFREKRILDITNKDDLNYMVKEFLKVMHAYPDSFYYNALYYNLKTDIANGKIKVNVIQDKGEYCAEYVNKRHSIILSRDYIHSIIRRAGGPIYGIMLDMLK